MPYLIFYMIIGWVIGFIGGMVGLVLGTIRYPFIFGAENMTSVTAGTNLAISTLAAITASIRHYKNNNIDFNIFLIMAISGAFGAILGTFLTKLIPLSVLLSIIVIIVSYEAVDLFRKSRNSKKGSSNDINYITHESRNNIIKNFVSSLRRKGRSEIMKETIIGFGVGLLGGTVGLVLGSIRMPAMITILKLSPRIAIGTNLASSSVMGTIGIIGHLLNNNIDFVFLLIMGPAAMLGAFMGARFTNKINESTIKFIISIALIFVVVTLTFQIIKLI